MAPPPCLLGPPELGRRPTQTPPPAQPRPAADPLLEPLDLPSGLLLRPGGPTRRKISSGNPCVDFFVYARPSTPAKHLTRQLRWAWRQDPLTTLKLIFNLRPGKCARANFYTAAVWLHNHHPKTLALNLKSFAEFEYLKGLPEILYLLLEGEDARRKQTKEWQRAKSRGRKKKTGSGWVDTGPGPVPFKKIEPAEKKSEKEAKAAEQGKSEKERASRLRKEKKIAAAEKAVARFDTDADFRFLHEKVSDLFAEMLKSEMENLKANQSSDKISMAAKWCPSIDSSFDRTTLICETIARKVFPSESCKEYDGVDEAHYVYRVRDRLRKEVLAPLRRALELPEVYMSARRWGEIPYGRVHRMAMKNYTESFLEHDQERFQKFLKESRAREDKSEEWALDWMPHRIVRAVEFRHVEDEVGELKWRTMVEKMVKLEKLKNCLAVCDVSKSMGGMPIEQAVALGLLISELSEDPWKGNVMSFSENPQLHLVQGDDLKEKCRFVKKIGFGKKLDFQKVYDLLLDVAVKGDLKPENMIKRVFVFTHKGIYKASANCCDWDYLAIERKFNEKGYGLAIPQLVFWNVRHSKLKATPVPGYLSGVTLLSGFSRKLLKFFLDNDGEVRLNAFMEFSISAEKYQKLVVHD